MNNTNWLLDFSKIENNHTWILKLIASNPNTLSVLANHNINLNVIDSFVVTDEFYKNISDIPDKISSILSSDPMSIVASLLKLKENFNSNISYLSEFLSKLDVESFRGYLKGSNIENTNFLLDNVGFTSNIYTNYLTYDKKIDSYIKKAKRLSNLKDKISDCLKISTKSSIEWRKVDLLKHSLGNPSDMIKLSLSLLQYNNESSENSKTKPLTFLIDIFSIYFGKNNKNLIALLEENFYTNTSFKLPTWKSTEDTVTIIKIDYLDDKHKEDTSLSYQFNKYLLQYESYKKSGATETLVLIVYNLLYNLVYRFKFMYNGIKILLDKNDKLGVKEREVIEHSIKKAIDSFERLVNKQVKNFFGLDDNHSEYGIDNTNSLELYPNEKTVGKSNIFRIMDGINGIKYKEKCNRNIYPIVLDYDVDGKSKGNINTRY